MSENLPLTENNRRLVVLPEVKMSKKWVRLSEDDDIGNFGTGFSVFQETDNDL